jgi:MFS family permease
VRRVRRPDHGRHRRGVTAAIGAAFAGLSTLWLTVSNGHVSDILVFGGVQGIGFGIAYAALGTLAVQHVPMEQSGIASGVNSLVRTTGGSVGAAVTRAAGRSHRALLHGPVAAGIRALLRGPHRRGLARRGGRGGARDPCTGGCPAYREPAHRSGPKYRNMP